ncbi:MAG: hypothetical protein RRZ24_11755 [Clostridia bacterium]
MDIQLVFTLLGWIYFIILVVSVALYVLGAIGLFTIGKRRGLKNYALSWVPMGANWALGDVADQYSLVSKGQKTSLRKVLLWLSLGAYTVYMLGALVYLFNFIGNIEVINNISNTSTELLMIFQLLLPMIIGGGIAMIAALVCRIFAYIARYRLFASCKPSAATTFIVLSIFFPWLLSIFTFAVRNHDEGMPKPEATNPAVANQLSETNQPASI